jgi:peptide/nickel transport system substrate-binding protein
MSTTSRRTIQTIRAEHNEGTPRVEIKRAVISRRTFLRWTGGAAGMVALGAFLPGCGPSVSAPTPTPIAAKPQKLIMGSAVDIYTLDPAVGFDTAIGSSLKAFYDALFRHVGNPPRVIPWLAESYEVSKDATEWTFKLVENAKFHDGSPVTAAAVKYSAERLLRIGGGPASLFAGILGPDSVSLLGDYKLKIKLLQPFGPFLDTLPWLFVINPDLEEANAGSDDGQTWLKDHEAGSGPFTMGEWKPGERYEFKAVPNYWKGWPAEGHVESYERRVIQDAAARVRALEQGEVHIIDWASPEEQIRLKQKGFFIVEEPSIMTYDIKLNNQEGYTADPHVRKAISYAFDYQALQKIWAGRAPLLEGPLPPSLEWAAKDLKIYRLDLEKAKAELAQSSQPQGGFDLDFVYVTGLEEERKTGEILRDQLANLNIKVNIIPMAWADAVGTFKNAKTSPAMFPLYSSTAYPDPDNYLWSAYYSSQAGEWTNPGHYKNPAMDDLLKRARATVDRAQRKELYRQAQQLVLDDATNVFGVSNPDFHVYSQNVKGLVFCPVMGSEQDFYSLRLQS